MFDFLYFVPWDRTAHQYNTGLPRSMPNADQWALIGGVLTIELNNDARLFIFPPMGRDSTSVQNMKTLVLLCQVVVLSHERKYGKSCAIVHSTTLVLSCKWAVLSYQKKYCAIVPSGCPVPWKKIWKVLCYCAVNNSCAIVPRGYPNSMKENMRENIVLLCQVAKWEEI